MKSKELLAREYLSTLSLTSPPLLPNIVIGIIGLPGTGKTSVARAISTQTGLLAVSNDTIRRFLNSHGFSGPHPDQAIVEHIAVQRTIFLLEKGISHIIDADLTGHVGIAQTRAEQYGFKFRLIEVVCPEAEALARINKRLLVGSSESMASEETYRNRLLYQRIHDLEQHDFISTIDTSFNMDQQVSELILLLSE